jgi:hypothetical protein
MSKAWWAHAALVTLVGAGSAGACATGAEDTGGSVEGQAGLAAGSAGADSGVAGQAGVDAAPEGAAGLGGSAGGGGASGKDGSAGSAGVGGSAGTAGKGGAAGTVDAGDAGGAAGTSGSAGTAGKAGSGGSGGIGPNPALGAICSSNADCGASLVCKLPNANDFLGGGPARGYCTMDCSSWSAGDGGPTDPCPALGKGAMCVSFDANPNDPTPHAFCAKGCTEGPPVTSQTFGQFDPNKCHGRQDVICAGLEDSFGTPVGFACIPNCTRDSDCSSSGRVCDPRWNVCVITPNTGSPLGSNCTLWAESKGDAGVACAGLCLAVLKTNEAGNTDPNNIAHFCSQSCVFGSLNSCGYNNSPKAGICIYAMSTSGNGDQGFCGQMCDVDAQCLDQYDNTWCDTSWAFSFGRGLCEFNYGQKKDAGPDGTAGSGGSGGAGGGDGSAGSAGSGGDASTPCPGTGGPSMISVPGGYCIDSTEVTNAQYGAWLATNPSTASQPSHCSSNTTFTPVDWPTPPAKDNYPVVNVDWCDAYAYCAAVGKRLCGKIGGGPNAYLDQADATKSQWFRACSSGGLNLYPYGNTYASQSCNGVDKSVGATVPVASLTACQPSVAGYQGAFDLSGNVFEWEDSCDGWTGANDQCRIHGGSFISPSTSMRCGTPDGRVRYGAYSHIGFRCCGP